MYQVIICLMINSIIIIAYIYNVISKYILLEISSTNSDYVNTYCKSTRNIQINDNNYGHTRN